MIRIENLRKEYDAKTVALDGIDLVFEDSTFVALLGPSGCGKTTTLNCIAGLLEPTSGKIFFGDKDVTQLAGGQQQRVSMARALVKEPDVLLLDEPMSNLDARLKIEIRDEIRRVQQETGITSIIVTHDQEEAMAIADKIAILDNGRIQQYDTPEHLYHYPANLFVAKFMGNPQSTVTMRSAPRR